MRKHARRRGRGLFHSLYFRLLGIYGLTFIAVVFAVGAGFRIAHRGQGDHLFRKNLENYAGYLASEIGSPPDLAKAEAIKARTGLDVAIIGPASRWPSQSALIGRYEQSRAAAGHPLFKRRDHFLSVERGGVVYLFSGPLVADADAVTWGMIVAILSIALLLALSHAMVRWTFRPLRRMKEAAEAYGDGRWDARVPSSQGAAAELAELGAAMNSMADRIQRHFKSMRELLIAVSHELRSPMTRMKVALEFVPDPKLRESLGEEIRVLDRMTEELLERERLSAQNGHAGLLRLEAVDLVPMLRELAAPFEGRAPGIVVNLDASGLQIRADRMRLAIAIRNLLENAAKHGAGAARPVEVSAARDESGGIRIVVRDFGPGIPPEALERLGEPFFQLDPARPGERKSGGFGLGLSLAYSIVQAHGGRVRAESDGKAGARFTIEIPKA